MAYGRIITWRIHPGQRQRFLAELAILGRAWVKYGGKSRWWSKTAAGPEAGEFIIVSEHSSFAEYAVAYEKWVADADFLAVSARLQVDPPATIVSHIQVQEMPMP